MNKISQGNAVFVATQAVLTKMGKELGSTPSRELLGDEGRNEVHTLVTQMFLTGICEFSAESRAKYDTDSKISTYVKGLCNNWWKKDKKLNGGTKYEPKTKRESSGGSVVSIPTISKEQLIEQLLKKTG